MATIDIIAPTWLDVYNYCNGKGWGSVFTFQGYTNPVTRTDIGALNTYRFYKDANKNSAPDKITFDQALSIINGYSEYQGTYSTSATLSLSYYMNLNRGNIISDPTAWTGYPAGGTQILIDNTLFTSQNFYAFYRLVGGVYEFKYFVCNATKNMNNQGVYMNMLAAENQLQPNVDAPMVINIGDSDQQLRGIEAMEALQQQAEANQADWLLIMQDVCEILNDLAENSAATGIIRDGAAMDISDAALNLLDGGVD